MKKLKLTREHWVTSRHLAWFGDRLLFVELRQAVNDAVGAQEDHDFSAVAYKGDEVVAYVTGDSRDEVITLLEAKLLARGL